MSGLSWSKQFDTLMVFLNDFFEKVNFKKNSDDIKACKISQHAKKPILHSQGHDDEIHQKMNLIKCLIRLMKNTRYCCIRAIIHKKISMGITP